MKPFLPHLSGSSALAASLTAAAHEAANQTIQVPASLYALLAVALALIGVYLARLVTIDAENKRLGRRQSLSETGPMTWIGILMVCPLVWHFEIAVPWAAFLGLGVGYSVRMLLKIVGAGVVSGARGMMRGMASNLEVLPKLQAPPPDDPEGLRMLEILDRIPDPEEPLDQDGDHR